MKLHLLRHAKTEVSSLSGKDFDRELMTKGIIQANVMGQFLMNSDLSIRETYCSEAVRTSQTLAIVSKSIECGKITLHHELYLVDRETLLAMIWKIKHKGDMLIIGHNDGLSQLASYFADQYIHLKTCGYVCLEFQAGSWKETSIGTGSVIADFRPQVYFPD